MPTIDSAFGPPLKLATKDQLICELTSRADGLMAVGAYELPDGEWQAATAVYAEEFDDPYDAHYFFSWLAERFRGHVNLPRPKPDGGERALSFDD